MLDRVLMLSAHRDDECLSAGGTLARCHNLHIRYFNNVHPHVKSEVYDAEAESVKQYLNCTVSYSDYPYVNRMDCYPIAVYVDEIERLINVYRPETIIGPFPSYNQDHRVVYDALLTAVRNHDTNFYVKNVLLAEQPETHTPAYQQFNPQLFVPIVIESKLAMYDLYRSQLRGHRSTSQIKALARLRGMQCNQLYAEAFQVVRATI